MDSIYFQNLQQFYKDYELDKIYHNSVKRYLQKNHKKLYDDIVSSTSFVCSRSFTERLYCYVNSIKATPTCKTCNNIVRFFIGRPHGYNRYCSQRCAMRDMKTLLGVDNPSQLQSVKDKKRASAIKKYGVDNVSKSTSIKNKIGQKVSAAWDKRYQSKKFTIDGLTYGEYSRRCHQYADTQYKRYKDSIDPQNLRGKHWHVDHIYSVSDGFINDVPVNIISDITNLRLISAAENYEKHASSHKSLKELYEDFNRSYASPTSSTPTSFE